MVGGMIKTRRGGFNATCTIALRNICRKRLEMPGLVFGCNCSYYGVLQRTSTLNLESEVCTVRLQAAGSKIDRLRSRVVSQMFMSPSLA